MIKLNGKVYAELIPEEVVLVQDNLLSGKLVVSAGERNVKSFNPGPKCIIITNSASKASAFSYNQPNKVIGINQNGELSLFKRLPVSPPQGRLLIVESVGNTIPEGALTDMVLTLEGGHWYEIEVLGAGGGGGSGIGKHSDELYDSVLPEDAKPGGDGGYYKGFLKLQIGLSVRLRPGNSGGGANGITWYKNGAYYASVLRGNNKGGDGGRTALLAVLPGGANDGLAPNNVEADTKLGGSGINSGANGGTSSVTPGLADEVIGCGGSGGGANGAYGGAGGDSIYEDTEGILGSCSGGGGGAGAGLNIGGDGGGTNPSQPYSFGAGAGGTGIVKPTNNYTKSGGGGGGGGSSVVESSEFVIIAGGGGGGSGAGYGRTNSSTPGGNGLNNQDASVGNGALGGYGGKSYILSSLPHLAIVSCDGATGSPGVIRIWRCI